MEEIIEKIQKNMTLLDIKDQQKIVCITILEQQDKGLRLIKEQHKNIDQDQNITFPEPEDKSKQIKNKKPHLHPIQKTVETRNKKAENIQDKTQPNKNSQEQENKNITDDMIIKNNWMQTNQIYTNFPRETAKGNTHQTFSQPQIITKPKKPEKKLQN